MKMKMKILQIFMSALLFTINISQAFALETPKFPSIILYKILKNNQFSGVEVKLRYSEQSQYPNAYALILEGFEGLGYKSDDKIFTYVLKDDLSLYDTQLVKDGKVVHEIKLVKRGDPFDPSGKKRDAFAYLKAGATSTMDTLLYSDYKVVGLISSFLFISSKLQKGDKNSEKLNLFIGKDIIGKTSTIVDLFYIKDEKITFDKQEVDTSVYELQYQGKSLFKFYIYNGGKFVFPVQISIEDENGSFIDLKANEVF